MKRFACLILFAAVLILLPQPAAGASPAPNPLLRIGLNGSVTGVANILAAANLLNHTGSGYEFGYIDDNMDFIPLGGTSERAITMVPYAGNGRCITVVITNTANVLFQHDFGGSRNLAVRPLAQEGEKAQTWHRNRRYYGMFEFRRINGRNEIMVISVVEMQDYLKGVIPYEMSPAWPLEALKAQTVSARSFAAGSLARHRIHGYYLCDTTHCQVYRGTASASSHSDRAVDETHGMYMTYNGHPTNGYYHASNGGATEDSENVWILALPYLRGVTDPYEDASRIPGYQWSYNVTNEQIANYLTQRGVANSGVSDFYVSRTTRMGNVFSVTIVGTDGQVVRTYEKESARTFVAGLLRFANDVPGGYAFSHRFSIGAPNSYHLTALSSGGTTAAHDHLANLHVIDGHGNTVLLPPAASVRLLGRGGVLDTLPMRPSPGGMQGVYAVSGRGHGHNVGMSQWGARSMSDLGYGFEDILKHYFTGVEIVTIS
jgi:stage II sporulation protein D